MTAVGQDTLKTRRTLTVEGKGYDYFSLPEAAKALGDFSRLPVSLKVLLENTLRFEDGRSYKVDDAKAIVAWLEKASSAREVPFKPARILLQDFTGVPAVVVTDCWMVACVWFGSPATAPPVGRLPWKSPPSSTLTVPPCAAREVLFRWSSKGTSAPIAN